MRRTAGLGSRLSKVALAAVAALAGASLTAACTGGPDTGATDGGTGGTDGGGGGGVPISVASFDRSCAVDGDCVAVRQGDVCSNCQCASAAIAKGALDAYNAKRSELVATCPPPETNMACGVDCIQPVAHCASGTCAFGSAPPVVDAGGD
jgi:hypothetical protein